MTANPPGGGFRLVHAVTLRKRVRTMGQRAVQHGIGQEFAAELRQIQDRLANDPTTWGEERAEYHSLAMTGRHAVAHMFHVLFAVNLSQRFVFVQNYIPLLDYEFLDPP